MNLSRRISYWERKLDRVGRVPPSGELAAAHDLRLLTKETRALLRALGYQRRSAMMKVFRQAARRLAPYRDAEALHETLDWLLEKERKSFAAEEIDILESLRLSLPTGQFEGLRNKLEQGVAACAGALGLLARDFAKDPNVFTHLRQDGLRTSFRALGSAWVRYYSRSQANDLHRLRKRVKDIQYLYEILGTEKSRKAFAKIGRRLGRSRDLARLAEQADLPKTVRTKIHALSESFAERAVQDVKAQMFANGSNFGQEKRGRRSKAPAPNSIQQRSGLN